MPKKQKPIRTIMTLKVDEMLAQPYWNLPEHFKDEGWKKCTRKQLFEAVLYLHEKLDQVCIQLNTERFTKKDVLYAVTTYLKKFEGFEKTRR